MNRECFISFTDICNWNCSYCDFPGKEKKQVSLDDLKRNINIIEESLKKSKEKWIFNLEGGELGTVSESILDYFFNNSSISEKYTVATNGVFLDKYYNKYRKQVKDIYFHIGEDFKDGDNYKKIKTYNVPNIFYVIVVHKNNLDFFEKLIEYHTDIMWSPQILQPRIENLDLFDNNFYSKILKMINNKPNIVEHFIDRFRYLEITDMCNLDFRRKMCRNDMSKIVISLTNNTIQRCCVSTSTSSVLLNEENMVKIFNGISPFPGEDKTCEKCIADSVFNEKYFNINTKYTKMILNNIKGNSGT